MTLLSKLENSFLGFEKMVLSRSLYVTQNTWFYLQSKTRDSINKLAFTFSIQTRINLF